MAGKKMKQVKIFLTDRITPVETLMNEFLAKLHEEGREVIQISISNADDDCIAMIVYEKNEA